MLICLNAYSSVESGNVTAMDSESSALVPELEEEARLTPSEMYDRELSATAQFNPRTNDPFYSVPVKVCTSSPPIRLFH